MLTQVSISSLQVMLSVELSLAEQPPNSSSSLGCLDDVYLVLEIPPSDALASSQQPQPSKSSENTLPMTTRSKNNIFKPKQPHKLVYDYD